MDESTNYIPDDELAAAPLDPSYRLRGENGSAMVAHVLGLMHSQETRRRRLRKHALELRRKTVEVLLANLAVSALHRINPNRPVAVSFHKDRYRTRDRSCYSCHLR